MRVFVAGAGGFIGRAAAEILEEAGHEVERHVRSRDGDLAGLSLSGGFDAVVNAAGRLGGPGVGARELEAGNIGPAEAIASGCADGPARVIHLSTPGVAGLVAGAREDQPPAPWGLYEESKARAEEILARAIPGDRLTILRPDFVYGPGDLHKLPLFRQVARGWFPLVGRGRARLRPTFRGDAARAVLAALPGGVLGCGVWNIGGPEVTSVRALAAACASAMGRRVFLPAVPRALYEAAMILGPLRPAALSPSRLDLFGRDHFVDTARASAAGFDALVGLAEGIPETVRWYRSQGLIG